MNSPPVTPNPEDIALARMSEFFSQGSSWHRRLWTIGTPLMLREVSEYATGVRAGLMRPEGLVYVSASAARQVARDPALDGESGRQAILEVLKGQGLKGGLLAEAAAGSFDEHIRRSEAGYLDRWATQVSDVGVNPSDAELVARLAGGFLLDAGFSPDHLHRWLKSALSRGAGLEEVLKVAASMARDPSRDYEVWVPYVRIPSQVRAQAGDRFMEHAAFLTMLTGRGIEHPTVRAGAGVLRFDVTAREPRAALVAAELSARRLRSRCVVGDPGERPELAGPALVINANKPKWHNLPRQGRVFLPTLRQHSGLFPNAPLNGSLEDALELLASVETSTTWASLAAIWAALEGLLSRPGTGEAATAVADRAADLVTCSFAVAELRALQAESEKFEGHEGLSAVLDEICSPAWNPSTVQSGAAVLRLQSMNADPAKVLGRIRGYFRDAFRRLYNQRNLVMHGGRFDSVALPATMRTMPPLVGAAVDRIVHGLAQAEVTQPLALAARASNELDLVGASGSRPIYRLLE